MNIKKVITASLATVLLASTGAGAINANASSVPTSIYHMSHPSHPHMIYKDPRTTAGDKYTVNYRSYKYTLNQLGRVISRRPLRHHRTARRHYCRHAIKRYRKRTHKVHRHVARKYRRRSHRR